jgi:hypothetical protein
MPQETGVCFTRQSKIVGPLAIHDPSLAAIGAIGIGNVVFIAVEIVGVWLLLGLNTVVSKAVGAGGIDRSLRALVRGLYLVLTLSPLLMAVVRFGAGELGVLGIDPAVLPLRSPTSTQSSGACRRQFVATSILSGAGDTRTPAAVNVVPYWSLGLPVAAGPAFGAVWGVIGFSLDLCGGRPAHAGPVAARGRGRPVISINSAPRGASRLTKHAPESIGLD